MHNKLKPDKHTHKRNRGNGICNITDKGGRIPLVYDNKNKKEIGRLHKHKYINSIRKDKDMKGKGRAKIVVYT